MVGLMRGINATAKKIADLMVLNSAIPPQGMSLEAWRAMGPITPSYEAMYVMVLEQLRSGYSVGANIALFDMDGSLADYDGAMLESLNALAGPDEEVLTRETLHEFLKKEELPHIKARLRSIKRSHGWWCRLKPIPAGMEVLKMATEIGFKPHILTKGPKRAAIAWKEKVEWCQHHIAEDIDIHITSDKGMVYGKVLYDDFPDYMLRWLKTRPRGLGIMPVTPSNRDFVHPNVIKWDETNLDEVRDALIAAFNRQAGDDWK